jgi:hypothetical protein
MAAPAVTPEQRRSAASASTGSRGTTRTGRHRRLVVSYRLLDSTVTRRGQPPATALPPYQDEEEVGRTIAKAAFASEYLFVTIKLWSQDTGGQAATKAFQHVTATPRTRRSISYRDPPVTSAPTTGA